MPSANCEISSILKAGEEGYVTNFTICPVNIVGPGCGPLRTPSQFIKLLVTFLLQCKRPTYPGDGSSRYNYVRVPTHLWSHDSLSVELILSSS